MSPYDEPHISAGEIAAYLSTASAFHYMDPATVRDELLRIFEAMRDVKHEGYGSELSLAARVQGLLRCAATHLDLEPLPGISLGIDCNRIHPGCNGCQQPKRTCRGRPEYTQGPDGRPLPGQLTMFPPDWQPPASEPSFFT